MAEVYITLEEAATYEKSPYDTIKKRVQRDSSYGYKVKFVPRPGGGKEQILVAVSSLSVKGRKAYRTAQRLSVPAPEDAPAERPWYADTDLNWYIETHKQAYYRAVDLAAQVERYLAYSQTERTAYAVDFASEQGISTRSLYRYAENLLEADEWARRLEQETGLNYDYFKPLSLCRKPRESGTFPSLTDEQRAVIENIWFDKQFAMNRNTIETLYTKFEEFAITRQWEDYPSTKTVARYVHFIMARRGAGSAHYLTANGQRNWKNQMMVKCKRDTSLLMPMEFVIADAHTFDFWVQYTHSNGKVVAVRPVLVAWIDVRTRCLMGDVFCVNSTSQIVKESVVKMVYTRGTPQIIHVDNGKDFTSGEMLGQNRSQRILMDSETKGFFRSIGAKKWTRSLPYQPWDKGEIERVFGTVCGQFSKLFRSYTGTLTGSSTDAKIKKDVQRMLERGELLTMEEAFAEWGRWRDEVYHNRVHRGLKDMGEQWTRPAELFENVERYEKAAPPREYAAILLMKADSARVTNQGITKFKTLYTHDELAHYVGKTVGVKWDIDDITKLYVFSQEGEKICEAYSAEYLSFGDHVSQEAIEAHKRRQNRQYKETLALCEEFTTPYEERIAAGRPREAVGKLELTIGHDRKQKIIQLPSDREYRAEMDSRTKRGSGSDTEFLNKKAEAALSKLKAISG